MQEAVAAKPVYGCQAAMVVTNSSFTQQAIHLARSNKVTLWDRKRLVAALLKVKPQERPRKHPRVSDEPVEARIPEYRPSQLPLTEPASDGPLREMRHPGLGEGAGLLPGAIAKIRRRGVLLSAPTRSLVDGGFSRE